MTSHSGTPGIWHNWAGLASARPTRVETPGDVDQLVAACRRALDADRTVKMVGTGHSFTGIAAPGDTMISPARLTGIVSINRTSASPGAGGTVTALAGTPLAALNHELAERGLTLSNMGDIAEQTIAGAVSTGTHGSGGAVASLSAQLAALQLVTGTGELVTASPTTDADVFDHARLGLGALGILATLTFRVEPLFVLGATEHTVSWEEFLAGHDGWVAEHDHVDAHWFPRTDRVLLKLNSRTGDPLDAARPLGRVRAYVDDDLMANTVFGAVCGLGQAVPRLVTPLSRVASRALSDRSYSDLPHRVFVSPRRVVFRECEYAVPRQAGPSVLREVRRVIDAHDWPIAFPVEIRTAPADDVPLSTSYGRESTYVAFHVPRRTDHRAYFAAMEAIMRDHDGRPHWGKLHERTAADLAPAYPRFGDFVALRERLDPDRRFTNPYLDRVLG